MWHDACDLLQDFPASPRDQIAICFCGQRQPFRTFDKSQVRVTFTHTTTMERIFTTRFSFQGHREKQNSVNN
jgi:hypothetical protein